MKKTIGILYICTGKYNIFWKNFYKSCENFLLSKEEYVKEYFVFTDAESIEYEERRSVHRIYQEALPWPYITLQRFKIFNRSKELYEKVDYLYFFNANMLCVKNIAEDFLPPKGKELSFLEHPGFFNKKKEEFTYERSMNSLAGIKEYEGKYYFAGGLSGGEKKAYLEMCTILEENIDEDLRRGKIALWHDESHLNRYAIDHQDTVYTLSPAYGYPEGWNIQFDAKIVIRDKTKYGGHSFLRRKQTWLQKCLGKLIK
jgi:hypothetical protein